MQTTTFLCFLTEKINFRKCKYFRPKIIRDLLILKKIKQKINQQT